MSVKPMRQQTRLLLLFVTVDFSLTLGGEEDSIVYVFFKADKPFKKHTFD